MFNPATFARYVKEYLTKDDNMCQMCGGSLKCCHEQEGNDA